MLVQLMHMEDDSLYKFVYLINSHKSNEEQFAVESRMCYMKLRASAVVLQDVLIFSLSPNAKLEYNVVLLTSCLGLHLPLTILQSMFPQSLSQPNSDVLLYTVEAFSHRCIQHP